MEANMSRSSLFRCALLVCFSLLGLVARGAEKVPLDVLYIGEVSSERGRAFKDFLEQHFQSVRTAPIIESDSVDAGDVDVVLLDWAQNGTDFGMPKSTSPLGKREQWSKPTVLMNSAGLLMAMRWNLIGGGG